MSGRTSPLGAQLGVWERFRTGTADCLASMELSDANKKRCITFEKLLDTPDMIPGISTASGFARIVFGKTEFIAGLGMVALNSLAYPIVPGNKDEDLKGRITTGINLMLHGFANVGRGIVAFFPGPNLFWYFYNQSGLRFNYRQEAVDDAGARASGREPTSATSPLLVLNGEQLEWKAANLEAGLTKMEKAFNVAGYVPLVSIGSGVLRMFYGKVQLIASVAAVAFKSIHALSTYIFIGNKHGETSELLADAKAAAIYAVHGLGNIVRGYVEIIPFKDVPFLNNLICVVYDRCIRMDYSVEDRDATSWPLFKTVDIVKDKWAEWKAEAARSSSSSSHMDPDTDPESESESGSPRLGRGPFGSGTGTGSTAFAT